MLIANTMLASEFFALSQGTKCTGNNECHWCGGLCDTRWMHDDPAPIPFVRSHSTARRPNNSYICMGCWLYRRTRVTVKFLGGEIKDRQDISKYSWLITKEDARVIGKEDSKELYNFLLEPGESFCLGFITESKISNLLQLAIVNYREEISKQTNLHFTVNNIPHCYTPYELEQALKQGTNGRMPGARVLVEILGEYKEIIKEPKKEAGRPKREDYHNPIKKVKYKNN